MFSPVTCAGRTAQHDQPYDGADNKYVREDEWCGCFDADQQPLKRCNQSLRIAKSSRVT